MSVPTLNLTYLVASSMAADILGGAIPVRQHGQLTMRIIVPSIAGTPNGLLSLQGRLDVTDANAWVDILGAFSELPGAGTSGALAAAVDKHCVWSGINFSEVRLKWKFTSGTGALSARYRSR